MSKKPLWAQTGHGMPVTRRELLAAGSISFAASLLAPNWLKGLLPAEAQAQESDLNCPPSLASSLVPMVTLNLSGGAAMAANFLPMDQGGQPLPSYDLMGLGDGQVPIEREFGNVPFAGMEGSTYLSKMLQGMRETAPTALAKTAFVALCVRSRDDSAENRFSIDGLVTAAGRNGTLLPRLGRSAGSVSGTRQKSALLVPSAPLVTSRLSSITGALGYSAALATTLNQNQKSALARTISRMSDSQLRRLSQRTPANAARELVSCANQKNYELSQLANLGVDPRQDALAAQFNTIWGTSAGTADTDQNLVFSAMVYNALKGTTSAAALELGGYDYHDGTRTRGDQADLGAGRTIGRILQMAEAMGRPVFLYVTSDGAVTSPRSNSRNAPWSSDRGIAGAAYMLYFDPAGRRATSKNQLGWFTSGQAAATETFFGNIPEKAAATVFANYLKINNRMGDLAKLTGRTFDTVQMDDLLAF